MHDSDAGGEDVDIGIGDEGGRHRRKENSDEGRGDVDTSLADMSAGNVALSRRVAELLKEAKVRRGNSVGGAPAVGPAVARSGGLGMARRLSPPTHRPVGIAVLGAARYAGPPRQRGT